MLLFHRPFYRDFCAKGDVSKNDWDISVRNKSHFTNPEITCTIQVDQKRQHKDRWRQQQIRNRPCLPLGEAES